MPEVVDNPDLQLRLWLAGMAVDEFDMLPEEFAKNPKMLPLAPDSIDIADIAIGFAGEAVNRILCDRGMGLPTEVCKLMQRRIAESIVTASSHVLSKLVHSAQNQVNT